MMFHLRKSVIAAGAIFVAAMAATPSHALSFDVAQQNTNVFKDKDGANAWYRNATVHLNNSQKSVAAGLFRLTATGADIVGGSDDFTAFCIDLGDWLGLPAEYSVYSPGFSSQALTRIDRLLSNVVVNNSDSAAATQFLLWEIVTDGQTDAALNLGGDGFKVVSTTSSALELANTYVAKLNGTTEWATMSGGFTFLDTEEYTTQSGVYGQELVTLDLATVPLPAAFWLLGTGVAAFGLARRKRA